MNSRAGIASFVFSLLLLSCGGGDSDSNVTKEEAIHFQKRGSLEKHSLGVSSVAFSPKGSYLASGSDDKTVKIWNTETWEEIRTLEGHTAGVYCVAFSPDGRFVVSGGGSPLKSAKQEDFAIRIWETETGNEVRTLTGHKGIVSCVAFSPFGGISATARRPAPG